MKNLLFLIGLFSTLSCWGGTPGNVEKYRKFVDSVATHYQIPSELIFGVGICESGFGTSGHAKRLNNYFGIRGRYSKVYKTSYQFYDTPEDGIVAFCKLVERKKFYSKLKGNSDPVVWIDALAKANYAGNGRVWTKLVKRGIASLK
jgi:flagellum-specific peptidoglycan hydrolase FlgJ